MQELLGIPRVCFYQAFADMIHFADAELCFDSEKGLDAILTSSSGQTFQESLEG